MAEIKKEALKEELEGMVADKEAEIREAKEAKLPEADRKAEEAKRADEANKAEEERLKIEEQAKKDAALLLKKDGEITDEAEKKRKAELLEKKQKEEEAKLSADEKVERIKKETQKRIDELSNKLKEITDKSSKEAQTLRQEITTLKKEKEEGSKPKEDLLSLVEKEESEKHKKYLDEDKSLPKEKRREMSDEELDEWLLEDQKNAVAWIQRRELRREIERRKNLQTKERDGVTKKLFEAQAKSYLRTVGKHPELNIQERKKQLEAEGKEEEEIVSILRSENKKYDLILKVAEENPDLKYAENGPELAMEKMEKLLDKAPEADEKSEIEKLTERIEALESENERLKNLDVGVGTGLPERKPREGQYTEGEQMLIDTMREKKATEAMIKEALEDYRKRQRK